MATGRCRVLPGAQAHQLVFSPNGLIDHVRYTDAAGSKRLRARIYVVACQAIESARLLLASAGPGHPNGLANRSGQVGRNLLFASSGHASADFPFESFGPEQQRELRSLAPFLDRAIQDDYDVDLAVTCARLHDTVEDTPVTPAEVAERFGEAVARGVAALSKDDALPKDERIADSLRRILQESREVAMVKLADRIVNLSEPPHYWSRDKRLAYQAEARVILSELGHASSALGRSAGGSNRAPRLDLCNATPRWPRNSPGRERGLR